MSKTDWEKIKALYIDSLVFPTKKYSPPILLCPVGLVGAGKTTVIKALATKLGLLRLSSDEIRRLLKKHDLGYEGIHEFAYNLIKEFLEKGYSIAIDADCASPETKTKIEEFSKQYNVRPIWIHINPPEEFILNNNKARNLQNTGIFQDGNQAIKNYYDRKPLHENLNLPFVYTFDTSKPNLEEQLEEAVRIIEPLLSK